MLYRVYNEQTLAKGKKEFSNLTNQDTNTMYRCTRLKTEHVLETWQAPCCKSPGEFIATHYKGEYMYI